MSGFKLFAGYKALAPQLAEAIKAKDGRKIQKGFIFSQTNVQEHRLAFIQKGGVKNGG